MQGSAVRGLDSKTDVSMEPVQKYVFLMRKNPPSGLVYLE